MTMMMTKKAAAMNSLKVLEDKLFDFMHENIRYINSHPMIAAQYGAAKKAHEIIAKFNFDHFFGEEVTHDEIGVVLGAVAFCAGIKIPCAVEWLKEAKAVAAA